MCMGGEYGGVIGMGMSRSRDNPDNADNAQKLGVWTGNPRVLGGRCWAFSFCETEHRARNAHAGNQLSGLPHVEGTMASSGPPDFSEHSWENVLQPWREMVQSLREQMSRVAVESVEQRTECIQQLADMHEQFSDARRLLEVRRGAAGHV